MNIYNKAHELANEIKNHPEVIEFRKASLKIKDNELSNKMLKDFREVQIEAYTEQMKNGKLTEATEKKLQNMASIISINPEVSSYLQSEQKFAVIWQDIIKILNDAVGVDITI